MNVTIKIACDNAAFHPLPDLEVARILRNLASKLETRGIEEMMCIDGNGNGVGWLTAETG
jgi:uncharacterized metal-binding protein